MSKTKRGFLLTSGILTIVVAVLALMLAVVLLGARGYITAELLNEVFIEEGVYYTAEEIEAMVPIIKSAMSIIAGVVAVFETAMLVLGILLLVKMKKGTPKGIVITLLILNAISFDLVTLGFLIASVCLKDRKPVEPSLQNVNEIANNNL